MPPRRGKLSLAEQLAELQNPNPVDIDPENEENLVEADSGVSDDEGESDDGRGHYTEVGKSKLRDTAAERPLKAAYKGQKSSRQDIFGEDDAAEDHDSADESDEEDDSRAEDERSEEDDDESDESESLAEDDDSLVDARMNGRAEYGASASDSGSGSDQSDMSEDESDGAESEPDSEDERQAADLKTLLADDQKTMVQEVVKTATAEAQKGRAVKKQLGIYDSLLDSRIKLQKGLQTSNILADTSTETLPHDQISATEHAALDLIEAIFSLRHALNGQEESLAKTSRKRKYNESEHVDSATIWRDIQEMDADMESWRDKTLTKWSQKTQAVSAIDKSKKFKALNQSILAQIEESKSDRAKLLKRTQIKRFKPSTKTVVSSEDTSPSIFDDGDFYQEMLKDLIDSRMLDSANGNQMKWIATKQPKQKKANVDTRASKGRKLRFHVHEKMQNFMAPIPMGTWHEEQVDELFGSLFGQSLKVNEDEHDGEETNGTHLQSIEVGDDFKLFG